MPRKGGYPNKFMSRIKKFIFVYLVFHKNLTPAATLELKSCPLCEKEFR